MKTLTFFILTFLFLACSSSDTINENSEFDVSKDSITDYSYEEEPNAKANPVVKLNMDDLIPENFSNLSELLEAEYNYVQAEKLNTFGYRYKLIGDFNGDSIQEVLTEHFVDATNGKETIRYEYRKDTELETNTIKPVKAYFSSSSKLIKTLVLKPFSTFGQFYGVTYAKMLGNINGIPGDEIALALSQDQTSGIGAVNIYSYQNGKWKNIFTIDSDRETFPSRLLYSMDYPPTAKNKSSYFYNTNAKKVFDYYKKHFVDTMVYRINDSTLSYYGIYHGDNWEYTGFRMRQIKKF